ncbi:hypothetical protein EZMO1_0237 [Endozoicomonas montiporae CL-33]|uniref:Uncharacterized protein n=1 Tax=Endozoicomonas montiporae CL-33 TaxID=570277 RepID=A0A142B6X6_9GAMM|nr:hypothetical protein [Endozoicomonas montiporae]AMO54502.1 hypothetical protein EZMO1_0237 [Endozoicomonas montiporae CL-33]
MEIDANDVGCSKKLNDRTDIDHSSRNFAVKIERDVDWKGWRFCE